MKLNIRELKSRADNLAEANREGTRSLVLLYCGVLAVLTLGSSGLNLYLNDQISGTGGLSGIGLRSVLSTAQSVLQLVQLFVLRGGHQLQLNSVNREILLDAMEYEQVTPSVSQAHRIKKLSLSGQFTSEIALQIMQEQKKPIKSDVTLASDKIRKFFPKSYTPMQMEAVIIKLLETWQRKRTRNQSR